MNTQTLTITIRTNHNEVLTSQHENMPAAVRHLERFAASHGWYYSRRRNDARNWSGAFNMPNKADHLAEYTITKR